MRFLAEIFKLPLGYLLPFITGFLLIFGNSGFSVFEILAVLIGIISVYIVISKELYSSIPTDRQGYLLLGFTAIVLLQLALHFPEQDLSFAIITLYLVTLYFLTQLWQKLNNDTGVWIAKGYIVGVSVTSILGFLVYVYSVFNENRANLPLFWGDNIRINGFFDDPVVYGAFLIPALLWLTVSTLTGNKRAGVLSFAILIIVFINLILTGSRGAWLNFIGAGVTLILIYKPLHDINVFKKLLALSGSCLITAILIIFVIPIQGTTYYKATLEHRYESSDKPRIDNIVEAPKKLLDREYIYIILGSGSGSYEKNSVKGFSAHNTYLRILYEQGIVGFLIFITLLFLLLKKLHQQIYTKPLFATMLFSVLVGILIQNLFVDTLHWRHFWLLIGLVI